jgi:hypothetical protein
LYEFLNEILIDYRNQFPEADTSQGSLIFIKSACLASALWGLYHYQEWISQQIFPDTADTEALEHHAWVRGLSRTYNEADSALLARLLDYIRRPPAGGNKYDYVKWAREIDNVASAYCFPLAQGLGTVDVVILANKTNTGAQVPSSYDTLTGTATSVVALKLIDTAATFQTSGVTKGDLAGNTSSLATAKVVSVDSETHRIRRRVYGYVPRKAGKGSHRRRAPGHRLGGPGPCPLRPGRGRGSHRYRQRRQ